MQECASRTGGALYLNLAWMGAWECMACNSRIRVVILLQKRDSFNCQNRIDHFVNDISFHRHYRTIITINIIDNYQRSRPITYYPWHSKIWDLFHVRYPRIFASRLGPQSVYLCLALVMILPMGFFPSSHEIYYTNGIGTRSRWDTELAILLSP